MTRLKRIPLLTAALATSLLAGVPVAKLSSTEAVTVKGVSLPGQSAYPVGLNDEIATKSKPTTIEFTDGSKVTIAAKSTVRLEQGKKGPAVRVLSGNVEYRLTPQSPLQILNASGKVIGQGMDTRMVQALAVTAPGQSSVQRVSTASASADMSSRTLIGGVVRADSTSALTQILLPNGIVLNVTPVAGSSNSFIINSIVVPVTEPGNVQASIPVTTGPIIGATITTPPAGSTSQAPTITMPGQTTPLTPTQAATQISNTANNALTQAPAGSSVPPPSTPVSTSTPAPPPPPAVTTSPGA